MKNIGAINKLKERFAKWVNESLYLYHEDEHRFGEPISTIYAEWVDVNPSNKLDPRMKCSYCGKVQIPMADWNGCPICLARMDKE